jgi:hypothetical protein
MRLFCKWLRTRLTRDYVRRTSETATVAQRDTKNGRFLPGNSGFGGRPKGSRNKLGEQFISDLAAVWQKHGLTALEQCAIDEPAQFCRVVASLLPKQAEMNVDVSVMHDVSSVVEAFRVASDLLGTDPRAGMKRLKNVSPMIEHDDER